MFYNLGKLVVRYRWAVIALWALIFLFAGVFAPKVSTVLKAGFGRADTESQAGLDILERELGKGASSITLIFSHDTLKVTDPEYQEDVKQALAPLEEVQGLVLRVATYYNTGSPYLVSADGHTTQVLVLLKIGVDEAMHRLPEIKEKLKPRVLRMWATDGVAIFAEMDEILAQDARRAESITLPVVLLFLLVVFGGVVAAGFPVALGAISVVVVMALAYFLGQAIDLSIFLLNIATFLGLGIAIDYTLFMVSRFREELESREKEEAILVTMATAGKAILFSGLTTVIGLSGLLFFDFMALRSIGIGGIMVVLVSMLLVYTFVPAVLAILGPRINAWPLIPRRPVREGFWHRLATGVMRYPVPIAVVVSVVLVSLGVPFLGVKLGAPWAGMLPERAESRQGWEVAQAKLGPGELSPILVVQTSDQGVLHPQNVEALYRYTRRIADHPAVSRVESIVTLPGTPISLKEYQQLYANPAAIPVPQVKEAVAGLTRGNANLIRVFSRSQPMEEETRDLVRYIRSLDAGGDLQTYVTGATADLMDSVKVMYGSFPWVIAFVMVTIYLALLVLFRSVVLPLKAIIMNGASIFASYGAMVFIFQEGHFQKLLGFTALGFTDALLPIFLFCLLFGLSMDYEIFLLSRIQERYQETEDNAHSVAWGLERTGRIITSAAMILVLVAGSFATSEVALLKALGLGMAIAIFLDASIVRAILVPALMRIMGKWNWWAPALVKKTLPEWKRSAEALRLKKG